MRAFLGGLSLASIFFATPLIVLLASLALAIRFRAWEVLFFGILIDVLYAPPGGIYGIPIPATIIACVVVVGFEPLRRKLMV